MRSRLRFASPLGLGRDRKTLSLPRVGGSLSRAPLDGCYSAWQSDEQATTLGATGILQHGAPRHYSGDWRVRRRRTRISTTAADADTSGADLSHLQSGEASSRGRATRAIHVGSSQPRLGALPD